MLTDGELLTRYARNGSEEAFRQLAERHGPMVLAACRRLAPEDADDAVQAVFLLLARKAGRLTGLGDAGPWLHRAARFVAGRAARDEERRRAREKEAAAMQTRARTAGGSPQAEAARRELAAQLDAAIGGLSEGCRQAVVLCHLEGLSQTEAAERLGVPPGTVADRCARGLARLRGRLSRRGAALGSAALAAAMAESASHAAADFAAGQILPSILAVPKLVAAGAAAGTTGGGVVALAEGALKAMFWMKVKTVAAAVLLVGAVAAGTGTPLVYMALAGDAPPAAEFVVLAEKKQPVTLFALSPDPGVKRAVNAWKTFFEQRGFEVELPTGAEFPDGARVLAFETAQAAAVAQDAALDTGKLAGDAHPESFVLTIQPWRGGTLVSVVGMTDRGTDAGAQYLLSKVLWRGDSVEVEKRREFRTPVFNVREAIFCPASRKGGGVPPDVYKEHTYEHWEATRLQDAIRYLKACGFNSFEFPECLDYGQVPQNEAWIKAGIKATSRENLLPVFRTMADTAHEEGMTVTQFIWGSADGFRWKDPATHEKRLERYRAMAKAYGGFVDHILTHWVDGGYEGGYVTPQEGTVFLLEEYRKYNPRVRASIDTWFNGEMLSRKGIQSMLDETYSPREVGVGDAVCNRPDLKKTNLAALATLRKGGRRVGEWAWYLTDDESAFECPVRIGFVDQKFSSYPADIGAQLDWLAVSKCHQGMPNDINLYVAARKMWDLKADSSEIVLDYCRAVYGPENGQLMSRVYGLVDRLAPTRGGGSKPTPHGDDELAEQAKKLLAEVRAMQLPPNWTPNFALLSTPEKYRRMIEGHLEQIAQGVRPLSPRYMNYLAPRGG